LLAWELQHNGKLFPDHLPSILRGALLGVGSLWSLYRGIKTLTRKSPAHCSIKPNLHKKKTLFYNIECKDKSYTLKQGGFMEIHLLQIGIDHGNKGEHLHFGN